MQITMIRNKGAFKKGQTYDLGQKKSTELLTGGYCVRVNLSKNKTSISKEDAPVNTKKIEDKEAKDHFDFKDKNKGKK